MRFEKNAAGEWVGILAMRGAKPVPANEAELPLWKRFMGMYEHDLQKCEKCSSNASIIKSQGNGQIIIKCVSCGASIYRSSINGKVQYFTIGWGQGPVVANAQAQQAQNIGDVIFANPFDHAPQIQWQIVPDPAEVLQQAPANPAPVPPPAPQPAPRLNYQRVMRAALGDDAAQALRMRQMQQHDRQMAELLQRNRARIQER